MKVETGTDALDKSWQNPFTPTTKCTKCNAVARIAFVAYEDKEKEYVCNLHPNDPDRDGFWLHDACAVAVYFCTKCFEANVNWNQA